MKTVKNGDFGFKVILVDSGKTIFKSAWEIDCEQFIFAKSQMKRERKGF